MHFNSNDSCPNILDCFLINYIVTMQQRRPFSPSTRLLHFRRCSLRPRTSVRQNPLKRPPRLLQPRRARCLPQSSFRATPSLRPSVLRPSGRFPHHVIRSFLSTRATTSERALLLPRRWGLTSSQCRGSHNAMNVQ